jgi:hypothetical protein
VIERLARNTAITCVLLSGAAWVWSRDARVAGGVLAGGAVVGLALWALAGVAQSLGGGGERGESGGFRGVSRGVGLVKFFTRHAILAFVAYVMMVRLHLDPVGMVVGVTSVVVAALVEAVRPR